jgi:HEAT repeat protein
MRARRADLLHDPIEEAWYLHKIETGSPEEVKSYGGEFRDFATVRAILGLLRILRRQKTRILDESDPLSGVFFATTDSIGPEAVAAVIEALNDDERAKMFSRTIWSSGTRALIICLRHSSSTVRLQSARILQSLPSDGRPDAAIPGLLGLLTDPAKEIRVSGACALVHSLPGNLAVRREIRAGLRDPDVKMRLETSGALLGPQARLAIPELTGALENPNEDQSVRLEAAAALGVSGCEEALPALTAALRDPAISQTAVLGLGELAEKIPGDSPEAKAAIEALAARLDTAQGKDLELTFHALGNFGPAAVAALPAAMKRLQSQPIDRLCATHFLRRMGPPAAPAVPLLIERLRDSLSKVQQNAAVALGAMRRRGRGSPHRAPKQGGQRSSPGKPCPRWYPGCVSPARSFRLQAHSGVPAPPAREGRISCVVPPPRRQGGRIDPRRVERRNSEGPWTTRRSGSYGNRSGTRKHSRRSSPAMPPWYIPSRGASCGVPRTPRMSLRIASSSSCGRGRR